MKLSASFHKKTFHFKHPSGTSRGVLTEKHAWFIELCDLKSPTLKGIGECSVIQGLSPDFIDFNAYENEVASIISFINKQDSHIESPAQLLEILSAKLVNLPSILFGLETALYDLFNGGKRIVFTNTFSLGKKKIPINGLIWMGDESFMQNQINEKLAAKYSTIKMKIGSIDFNSEYRILESIRDKYTSDDITIRVDANGAYTKEEASQVLYKLEKLQIHSIEQPIASGSWEEMSDLCRNSPIDIALDEELIGINERSAKNSLLDTIKPQFIILKPSLHGGIAGTKEWIELAESKKIGWWLTSALESNIGLNAICQLAGEYNNELPQGLGTGSLYTDNIPSDLVVDSGTIYLSLQNAD